MDSDGNDDVAGNNRGLKREQAPSSLDNSELVKKVNSNEYISKNTYSFKDMIQNQPANKSVQDEGGGGGGGGLPIEELDKPDEYSKEEILELVSDILSSPTKNKEVEEEEAIAFNSEFIDRELITNANATACVLPPNKSSYNASQPNTPNPNLTYECIRQISEKKSTIFKCTYSHGERLPLDYIYRFLQSKIINKNELAKWPPILYKSLTCMYSKSAYAGTSSISACSLDSIGHREAMDLASTIISAISLENYKKGAYATMEIYDRITNTYNRKLKTELVTAYKDFNVNTSNAVAGMKAAVKQGGPITEYRPTHLTYDATVIFYFSELSQEMYNLFKQVINTDPNNTISVFKYEIQDYLKRGDTYSSSTYIGIQRPRIGRCPPLAFISNIIKPKVDMSDISTFDNFEHYMPYYSDENESEKSTSLFSFKPLKPILTFITNLISISPSEKFKQLIKANIPFLKNSALTMIQQWNDIFSGDEYLEARMYQVFKDENDFMTRPTNTHTNTKKHQILMTRDLFQKIKQVYRDKYGGNMTIRDISDSDLDQQITDKLELKVAQAPAILFYLLDNMCSDVIFSLIEKFKDNGFKYDESTLSKLQRELTGKWLNGTLNALENSVDNWRSVNSDYSCKVSNLETEDEISNSIEDSHNRTSNTQDEINSVTLQNNNKNNTIYEAANKVVEGVSKAGFVPKIGGKMIRNKSSVRNRVTRKRKTKRRTTRKRRYQCKRRMTKKRNRL
jgi:hypothetical protein